QLLPAERRDGEEQRRARRRGGAARPAGGPQRRERRRGQGAAVAERRQQLMRLPGEDGPLGRELAVAFALARQAGAEVRAMQAGTLGVEMKPGDEPVTVADRRASEII